MRSPTMSSAMALALAPAREGRLLPRNRQKPRPNEDALVLFPAESGAAATEPAAATAADDDDKLRALSQPFGEDGSDRPRCSAGIGRHELRLAHWQACPCHVHRPRSSSSSSSSPPTTPKAGDDRPGHHRPRQRAAPQASSFCHRCEYPWTRHLGRTFLKLQDDGGGGSPGTLAGLWVKAPRPGEYPILDRMRINGRSLREYGLHPAGPTIAASWRGPFPLRPGDSIRLEPPTGGVADDGDSRQRNELEFQVVAQRDGRLVPMPASYHYVREAHEPPDQGAELSTMPTELLIEYPSQDAEDTESPLRTQLPEHNRAWEYRGTDNRNADPSRSQNEAEPSLDASTSRMDDTSINRPSVSSVDADIEAGKSESTLRRNTPSRTKPMLHPAETRANDDTMRNPRLYFVKCNRYWDMHDKSIRDKAMQRASARGATVLDKFDRQNLPTHLIVDRNFRLEDAELLNDDLKFQNVQEMQRFLQAHSIVIARLNWVMKDASTPFRSLLRHDEMYQLPAREGTLHKRQTDASNESVSKRMKDDRHGSQKEEPINDELIQVFTELSHLYRDGPVDEQDAWRAFTFTRAASIIRNLNFGVTSETLQELKRQKGLKDSCIKIVQEYLQTRRCERLEAIRTDEYRISLRAFTGIWGVGPKRAKELIHMGYRSIGELREATERGKLKWLRNEYLGLKYYEDINEEMSRQEAKMIVDIVTAAAHSNQLCPTASVEVQGSYRRGKETCGDVDFIITDSSWADEVPPTFLGRLADKLREDGFVVHHLTMIRGMNPNTFETLDTADWEYIRPTASAKADKRSEKSKDKRSYTWFGICRSPIHPNKIRRVDIKCYPFADHIYAWLYFTGNGHFNRAMRFWSKKQKEEPRYHLDDHGLWELNAAGKIFVDEYGHHKRASTKDGDIFVPGTERDVFDFLNLAWKEPNERDGFGALRTKDDGKVCDIPMTFADLLSDSKEHSWVD